MKILSFSISNHNPKPELSSCLTMGAQGAVVASMFVVRSYRYLLSFKWTLLLLIGWYIKTLPPILRFGCLEYTLGDSFFILSLGFKNRKEEVLFVILDFSAD